MTRRGSTAVALWRLIFWLVQHAVFFAGQLAFFLLLVGYVVRQELEPFPYLLGWVAFFFTCLSMTDLNRG